MAWRYAIAVALFVAACGPGGLRLGFPGPLGRAPSQTVTLGGQSPAAVDVEQTAEVIWENRDSQSHSVTADSGAFDSGEIKPGEAYSRDFDEVGSFVYHCSIHPGERSLVAVHHSAVTLPNPTPSPSPSVTPTPSPSATPTPTLGGIFR